MAKTTKENLLTNMKNFVTKHQNTLEKVAFVGVIGLLVSRRPHNIVVYKINQAPKSKHHKKRHHQ